MEQKVIITQSTIKAYQDYHLGNECGLVFVEKYINKRYDLFPPSDSMQVGNWFEYQCLGATTKSDLIPQPEKTKSGELTAPYKRMQSHINNFKLFMTQYGIEIVSVQEKLKVGETIIEIEDKNTGEIVPFNIDGLEGTTDAICRATKDIYGFYDTKDEGNKRVIKTDESVIIKAGEKFIMDVKTSGLLSDKFSDFGWHLDYLSGKEKIIRQPIHYKYVSELIYGKQYPFLFLLFSQTNEYDFRSILFNIDEDQHIKEHKERIVWTNKWIKYHLKKGFKANPDVVRCHDCPLKVGCKHFAAVPKIQIFYYQPQTT